MVMGADGETAARAVDAGQAHLTKVRATLTQRQQQCLDFIIECIRTNGMPPTIREIGKFVGIKSTNGVMDHLRALERKGIIQRSDEISRGIRVVGMTAPLPVLSGHEIAVDRAALASSVATLEALSDWVPGPMKEKFENAVTELKVQLMRGRSVPAKDEHA